MQKYLEDKFIINIINIMKNNKDLTENQKHEIISIFKQKYTKDLINIYDCETNFIQIFNNFNIFKEPGNIIITERFMKDFHKEWEKYIINKNEPNYQITEENNWIN